MRNKYPQEFKGEAVRQVIDNGYSIKDVANRLGITDKSLYNWVNKAKKTPKRNKESENNTDITKNNTILKVPNAKIGAWFPTIIVFLFGSLLAWDYISGYVSTKSGKVYENESPLEFNIWIIFKLGLLVYIIYLYFDHKLKNKDK